MKFFAGSRCQHIKRFGHKTAQDPGYHLAVKLSTPDSPRHPHLPIILFSLLPSLALALT